MARLEYVKVGQHSGSHDEEELQQSHSKEEGHGRSSSRRGCWVKVLGGLLATGVVLFACRVYVAQHPPAGGEGEQSMQQAPGAGVDNPKAPPPFWRTGPKLTPEQAAAEAALQAKKDEAEDAVRATGGPLQERVRERHRQWEEKVAAEKKQKEEEAAASAAAAAAAEKKKAEEEAAAAAAAAPAADAVEMEVDGNEVLDALQPLVEARRLAEVACKEMEMDYGVEDALQLFGSLHFRNRDFVKRKLARAVLQKQPFVVSFAGTSVTAGHDNFFNQSYPVVFGRILQPVFEAAGVGLVVRNHAMGNNPAVPSAFCVGAQLGEDTDVAVWEFGMMVGGPLMLAHVELWLRNALALPKRPALLFLDPGEGARKPDKDGKLPTEPRLGTPGDCSNTFGVGDQSLLQHYEAFGPHVQAMYEAVWTLDHTERYNFNALVMEGKATPRPASWHPGPKGHALRANILAHHYLRLLDDALADAYAAITADLKAGGSSTAEQAKLLAAAAAEEAAPLPEPLHCDPRLCQDATRCALMYEPRAAGAGLQEALVAGPEVAKTAVPSIDAQDSGAWHVQLYTPDHEAVAFAVSQAYGYLDRKYALQGNAKAGPLTLRVTTTRTQRLFVCQPPAVWGRQPEDQAFLHGGATVAVDGKAVPLLPLDDPFYEAHKLEAKVCFATAEEVAAGEHGVVLTPTEEGKYVALSAVVWY